MIAAILLLQIADILTTYHLVYKKGMREANPIMNWAMKKLGFWPALLILKGIFVAYVLTIPMPYYVEIAILIMYLVVVGNNLWLVRRLG